MKAKLRKDGFLLPLALLSLLVVSILAMSGFSYVQHHLMSLEQKETSNETIANQSQFVELAFQADKVPPFNTSSQSVPLSGLYNLSFLISRDVHGRPILIDEQISIVRRLLTYCANVPELTDAIVEYLRSQNSVIKGFGLLDLLNELSVPMELGVTLLPCVRILPRSYKINLSLSTTSTLQAYFDLNSSDASLLKRHLMDGTIPNHHILNLFLQKRHKARDFSRSLRNTTIVAPLDHKATILEYGGETFAYLDSVIDPAGIWTEYRNFFLWVPTD